MSFDMVDHGGGRHPAFARTESAERMLSEESHSRLLPCRGVAALARRTAAAVIVVSPLDSAPKPSTMMKRWSNRHAFRLVDRPAFNMVDFLSMRNNR
jgi:hypothetical protein